MTIQMEKFHKTCYAAGSCSLDFRFARSAKFKMDTCLNHRTNGRLTNLEIFLLIRVHPMLIQSKSCPASVLQPPLSWKCNEM